MRELNLIEIEQVTGGIHIRIGTFIAAVVIGAVTAGPVGIGYAIAGAIMAEGIDNLADMSHDHFGNPR